jgi:hypothetical protein
MNFKIKPVLKLFTVDKYYQMNDQELQNEAAKWRIGGYSDGNAGIINRQVIVDALIKKDKANDSRVAIFISVIALVISILGIILK